MQLPIVNHKGNSLVALSKPPEDELKDIFMSMIVARYKQDFVLVYNNGRQAWEIPGGRVDKGESPRQAAIRELFEESTQSATKVNFMAELGIYERATDQTIKCALFSCELDRIRPFQVSQEISAIKFWNNTKGEAFDAIDEALISLFFQH